METITDKIKSLEDACGHLGIDIKTALPYPEPKDEEEEAINAVKSMWIIARALNEGWKPDWSNYNERKWYPYFEANSSGFGFSHTNYDSWNTNATVGSRLCFKSEALAKYAGTKFIDTYNKFL